MRIHSLEICGFKSFGQRSTLAFDRGISAIVGPNGCGKSNVVDAIRWVMGEQNPRKLRGRQMEDIIFAGTETQPQVGMAEVIMTLDNSSGTAPAPYTGFSEIQVTRRLYRSGESEYLINKVPVRLRDVLDFFLDTGIGARGYTIVEQGAIASIVSSKPEERRQIFEEAAGIGKYRARRKETESKLRSTEQNLLRVNDVLGELKRQISSLERQARKASRYKELASKLRDLELGVTAEQFRSGQGRLAELEREVADVRAASLGLDARVARAESLLEAGRRSHLDRDRELQATSERLYAVRGEIQTLENQIQWETRERESLEQGAAERAAEIARLETQIAEGARTLEAHGQELGELEGQLEALRAELAQREREHQQGAERLMDLHVQRDASQAQRVRLAAETAKLESRAASLDERARELEARLRANEERLAASQEQAEGLLLEASKLEERLSGGRAEQDDFGRQLGDLLRSQDEAHSSLEVRRRDLAQTREELQQIGARLEALREAERDATRRMDELLASLPEEERSGIRGLLSGVIQVEDGYERAFEAAMSHRSDLVLVDDAKAALALLGSFRRLSAVRASALPLASGGRAGPRGFVPLGRPLLGFVHVEQPLRLLLERLLRDVYVVDSLGEAVERYGVAELPGVFVTPEGDILERNGVLTSGGGASGVLSRAGEIRRLEARADPLETRAVVLAREVAELEHLVEVFAQQTDTARSRRHSAELSVVNLERDLERTRERSEELAASQEGARSGQADLLTDRQRALEEGEEIRVRLEAIQSERQAVEKSGLRVSTDIAVLAQENALRERHVSESRVEIAERSARRSQLRQAHERVQGELREQQALIARRSDEVRSARERIAVLSQSSSDAQRALTDLIEQEEEVRGEQEALRAAFEAGMRDLEELEGEVRSATRERGEVRERVAERELAVQEVRLRQEQLRERILERYGVELASYEPPAGAAGTPAERQAELARLRQSLDSLGDVHLGAIEEHEDVSERHRYLAEQKADLEVSLERLRSAIARINRTSRARFKETFEVIDAEFQRTFPRMFRGGRAHLSLTDSEDVLDAGIEITAQPPGKKLQSVLLLSGGEKALTALALLMAVFTVRPSPFFLLDEVDAALDDANVGRYDAMLREMSSQSQFLVITHNKASIEGADRLFGVTMQEPGLSKLVTVELVA